MAKKAFPATYRQILSPEQLEYMMDMMYSEQSLRNQMTVDNNVFFICEGKGYVSFRFVGMVEDSVSLFHLEKLYVLPEFQGCGLGRQLFDTVVSAAKDSAVNAAKNPAVSFVNDTVVNAANNPAESFANDTVVKAAKNPAVSFANDTVVKASENTVVSASEEVSAGKIRIELNVNRFNKAVSFYEHIGMYLDRQGDFPIGRGFFMNDYIMAIDL